MSNWELLRPTLAGEKRKRPRDEPESAAPSVKKALKKKRTASKSKLHAPTALEAQAASATATRTANQSSAAPALISAPMETLVVDSKSSKIGKYLALDCEMIGTNAPPHGPREQSTLARVSITNYHGHIIYDSYVAPPTGHVITDYRTWVSGIKAHHLHAAPAFESVQAHVKSLLKGRILVGHALVNDFRALQFTHPKHMVRDTSTFGKFKAYGVGKTPGLKKVAHMELGIQIQGAEHSSVEDARACMALYRKYKPEFEQRAAQKVMA